MAHHQLSRFGTLITLFILFAGTVDAQDCGSVLSTAQVEYDMGHYDAVVEQLSTCLQVAVMSGSERGLAYRLIAMSHLEMGQQDEAADAVRRMFDNSPHYRLNPETDSRAFGELVEAERRRRARLARSTYLEEMEPFRFSAGLHGAMLTGNKLEGMHVGGVGSFGISYYLTPNIGVDGSARIGVLSSELYSLLALNLGVRYLFTTSGRFAPYVGAGVAYQSSSRVEVVPVDVDGDPSTPPEDVAMFFDVSGVGGTVYGGLLMALSPTFALDFQVSGIMSPLDNAQLDESVASTTGYIGIGVVWAPGYR